MPDERLVVGRVGRPHGLRGEVTVMLVTDRTERMEPGSHLHADDRELVVESSRTQRDGWVVQFGGVTDVDAAESLRGATLRADPIDVVDDALWAHELIGCAVADRAGTALGTVAAVQPNPAHDLLELDTGALIPMPFVVEHLPGSSDSPGRVIVDPPPGLLDL
jgi:16S rRNA processing protein RimM